MPLLPETGRRSRPRPSLGLFGFGAFGRLAARHLRPHVVLRIFDPALPESSTLAEAAACDFVVLAVPVAALAETLLAIAPHLRPGALVLDVGSVKVEPARRMLDLLPADVEILATHPLFGPQSAKGGLAGLKIVLCPLRGRRARLVAAFLRAALRLEVIRTTPEAHDRDAALSQGLTHLVAKLVLQMEPLPNLVTTRSFDLLREAVEMVRHDAPEVLDAIERLNPYAPDVRRRFLDLATGLPRDREAGADLTGPARFRQNPCIAEAEDPS